MLGITLDKTQGTGSATVRVTSQRYSGRLSQRGTLTVSSGGAEKYVSILRNGAPAVIDCTTQYVTLKADATDRVVEVRGTSNSSTLQATAAVYTGNSPTPTQLHASYISYSVNKNQFAPPSVPGDPGASNSYVWLIEVDCSSLGTSFQREVRVTITGDALTADTCFITIERGTGGGIDPDPGPLPPIDVTDPVGPDIDIDPSPGLPSV